MESIRKVYTFVSWYG